MLNEIWKDVLGWEGKYQASSTGRIKSLGSEKIMKPRKWKNYERLYLCKGGKRFGYQVHRLVWEAFNGPIQEVMEIDHIDGDPSNNRLENLRAVSHLTNLLNPVTRERNIAARKKILSPEQIEERRKRKNELQRERYKKRAAAKHEQMLLALGVTEEEYQKNKELERKEKEREWQKRYYEKNKKKFYESKQKWEAANIEKVREYHKQYWEQNKHKYRPQSS